MALLLVPLQAAAEEYVFRGWLLQAVGAYLRTPWVAIAFQAVLFAAAHGWGTRLGLPGPGRHGRALGWLTVRTGGLEAAIALHVVNNLVAFTVAAAFGGARPPTRRWPTPPGSSFVVDVLVTAATPWSSTGWPRGEGWRLSYRRRCDAGESPAPDPDGPDG